VTYYHNFVIYIYITGSAAYKKLEEMLTRPRLIAAIRKLSQHHQTSGLEAKHSLDNLFASKNTYHSYHSLSARLVFFKLWPSVLGICNAGHVCQILLFDTGVTQFSLFTGHQYNLLIIFLYCCIQIVLLKLALQRE
jgi:hypothetical protein